MKNHIDTLYRFSKFRLVVEIGLDKFEIARDLGQIFARAGNKIVDYCDLCSPAYQFIREVRTDEPGTASNEAFRG